jgi:hypothetical protein
MRWTPLVVILIARREIIAAAALAARASAVPVAVPSIQIADNQHIQAS